MRIISLAAPLALAASLVCCGLSAAQPSALAPSLWDLARSNTRTHRFSTLFTAQNVRDLLSNDDGIAKAIDWCKNTAVTKVYIESFRGNYQAPRELLENAKKRFALAGIQPSGCITPTRVLKLSNNWKEIACFTDKPTQDKLQAVFEFAASIFDEIMIDDFYFTDCTCADCDAARKSRTVTIGDKTYPVPSDTWEDYHCTLMVHLSRDRVLAPAKKVNPNVKLIIKYPQWYDNFHERGYEVLRQSADFDRIWVGTETRDYTDRQWGGTPQYEAYFIMRWLGGIGGPKCGGGWFDPYGTTEKTYIEQARQTILAGARESTLFCYGSLLSQTGPKNIEALRANIPELFTVAAEVARRPIIGVAAYKPPNSHPETEKRIFDFVGMMGLPLVPCHQFPADAPAAFFSIHALKDPDLPAKLTAFIAANRPVLLTDALAARLTPNLDLTRPNVRILPVKGDPKSLLNLPQDQLDPIRLHMLQPFKTTFRAPNKVALYLFNDSSHVIENFNDTPADVQLNDARLTIASRSWVHQWK